MLSKAMIFDVCIPVYKPDEKLDALLKGMLSQVQRPRHILLMITDDGSDVIESMAEGFRGLDERIKTHIIKKSEYDHAGTRNIAVSMCEEGAECFLLMTQDAVPSDNHLTERLIECFADKKVAVAYARQLAGKHAAVPEKCARRFNYPAKSQKKGMEDLQSLGIKTFFCSNVCAMYRKSIFEKLGGFEAPAIFNEDMVYASLAVRNGYYIYYAANARVIHAHRYSLKMQFIRSFDNGASHAMRLKAFEGAKASSEGSKYVKETIKVLRRVGQTNKIPYFILQSAFRYLGFALGKNFKILPKSVRKLFSLNKTFWDVHTRQRA